MDLDRNDALLVATAGSPLSSGVCWSPLSVFGSLPVSYGIRPSGVASAAMSALAVAFLPTGSCMTSGRDDDTGQACDDRLFWDF